MAILFLTLIVTLAFCGLTCILFIIEVLIPFLLFLYFKKFFIPFIEDEIKNPEYSAEDLGQLNSTLEYAYQEMFKQKRKLRKIKLI